MFWMLKRTVSLRRFFWVPTKYVLVWEIRKSILVRTLNNRPKLFKQRQNHHLRTDSSLGQIYFTYFKGRIFVLDFDVVKTQKRSLLTYTKFEAYVTREGFDEFVHICKLTYPVYCSSTQIMRYRWPSNVQLSLCICINSPEPSLLIYTKYEV